MRGYAFVLLLLAPAVLSGQQAAPGLQGGVVVPGILSTPGPLFVVPESELRKPVRVIAYGDTRFTDPTNVTATNPAARRALVEELVKEHPDALLISGDLPYRGNSTEDYGVFRRETKPWRDAGLRVYPALGNHEYAKCEPAVCLENWWNAFPEMPQLRERRWYSAQLGKSLYLISLDSAGSLLPGSEERKWLEAQLAGIPKTIRFVILNLHHPPVADVQTRMHVDHNPRPNEMALRDFLTEEAKTSRAKFVVVAGHIHNYERFEEGGVMYFVSGGGGAQPYEVDRTPEDLYQQKTFPNYHFIRFTLEHGELKGEMVRLENPGGERPVWKVRDRFSVR